MLEEKWKNEDQSVPLNGIIKENASMTCNLNKDLNGVRVPFLWIIWRKKEEDSNSKGPDPTKSLACSNNSKRASIAGLSE